MDAAGVASPLHEPWEIHQLALAQTTHIQILHAEILEMRAELHALQITMHQMGSSFYAAGSALSHDLAAQCDLGGPSTSAQRDTRHCCRCPRRHGTSEGGTGDDATGGPSPSGGGSGDATGGPSPPSGGGSDEDDLELMRALCFISEAAQQLLENAGEDAGVASLLHEPWEIHQLAQAYDSVASDDSQPGPELKDVQRCIRDMIVIKAFLGDGNFTWRSFHSEMQEVFCRSTMEQNLEAQVIQAACTIRRLGSDRVEFDRWLSGGQYGTATVPEQEVADDLFAVFNRCANVSPDFHPRNAKARGARKRPKKTRRGRGRRPIEQPDETEADETVALDMEPRGESSATPEICQPLAWLGGIPDDKIS